MMIKKNLTSSYEKVFTEWDLWGLLHVDTLCPTNLVTELLVTPLFLITIQ